MDRTMEAKNWGPGRMFLFPDGEWESQKNKVKTESLISKGITNLSKVLQFTALGTKT